MYFQELCAKVYVRVRLVSLRASASCLQIFCVMKDKYTNICRSIIFVFVGLLLLPLGVTLSAQQLATRENKPTPEEQKLIDSFNRHVKDYLKQRDQADKKVPAISKEATPEEITAYQAKFVAELRGMRAGTKQGYIFQPAFADYVRSTIKTEFPPADKAEIKQTILEADTKGVPLRVNYPYPETKELSQVPPTLLLKLPQLPKQVKYRFVGRHMLLVDTDNGLIVDYMLNALP